MKQKIPTLCRKLFGKKKRAAPDDIINLTRSAFLCLGIGLAIFFYISFFRGGFEYGLRAYQELSAKKRLLGIKIQNRDSYEMNHSALENLKKELDALSGEVIAYKDIPAAMDTLSEMMVHCDIVETYFFSGGIEEIPAVDLDEPTRMYIVRVQLSGIGTYENVLAFISMVNDSDIRFDIDDAGLSVVDSPESGFEMQLQLSFYAYQMMDWGRPPIGSDIGDETPFQAAPAPQTHIDTGN